MVLYIHGFGGNGLGKKAAILRNHFHQNILAPSLSYIPELAADTLEQLIHLLQSQNETVHLVGSSAGGYLSIYLAEKYNLKAVLINPAIHPYRLTFLTGMAKNYFDNSTFECKKEHLEKTKKYEVLTIKNENNFLLLLSEDDEILDHKEALKKFPKSQTIIDNEGKHEFKNFEREIQNIKNFFFYK